MLWNPHDPILVQHPSIAVEDERVLNFHFLRYLHSDVPQYTDASSIHRLSRVKQLPQPTNSSDILALLGDTADPDYPIYRTATGPDGAATLATGKS